MSLLLVLALQSLAGKPADHRLTVREVIENAQAHDGRIVIVSGWIESCEPVACSLFESRTEALRRGSPHYQLSIGRTRWFDSFAGRRAPFRVSLRARFDARCVTDPRDDVIAICTDRPASLRPIALVG